MHHRRTGARRLCTMMAWSLLLLVPGSGSAESPSSPSEDASLRKEWEKVRANQERAIRDNQKRLAEIYARVAGPDEVKRAEKTTRDRVAAANASLKDGGKSQLLVQMAETAGRDGGALASLYAGQDEYLDRAIGQWESGTERKNLETAISLLQRNMEHSQAHLARASETAEEMSTQLGQSGVLDKVLQIETAAKEAGARLSVRWELERAARERERQQREREAGERAREQRQ
jgi:hypothetical protein